MNIGLFLGAGASVPFGMPTTASLLSKLEKFSYGDIDAEVLQSFLHYRKYPDIEYVLQALRDIKSFERSRGGNYFFENLQHGIFSYSKKTLSSDEFINKIVHAESTLEQLIYENYRWKYANKDQLAQIYDELVGFLRKQSEHIQIFTTNYDRAVEEYCIYRDKYACIDGFERKPSHSEISRWTGNFEVPNESRNLDYVQLYKLHGSLTWKEHVEYGIVKTNEEAISPDSNFKQNIVIMPTLSPKKQEEIEPFRTIIAQFVNFMENVDGCIVIGFSFRDQRINDIFKSFVKKGKTLVTISPNSMGNVCSNLFGIEVPEDYDKGKVSLLVPVDGNVWSIPHKFDAQNIRNDLNVALAHVDAGLKKS